MSTIKVDTIKNRGNAINLPNNFKIGGNSIIQGYTASGTEPSSPATGDFWWDSSNDKLYRYINGEFKELTLVAATDILWGGDRGVFAGGQTDSLAVTNTIDYMDITSASNAQDFGNLTASKRYLSGASSTSRGLVLGGYSTSGSGLNVIEYVTIASPGNGTDFGDLNAQGYYVYSCSDGTKAFTFGGYSSPNILNNIQQRVIATTGNASDFGNLSTYAYVGASCSDTTRAVHAHGRTRTSPSSGTLAYSNTMEYITTANAGNATDFGDTTTARGELAACSDYTRGVFAGGYNNTVGRYDIIDYITIQTTGNATDFGDLISDRYRLGGASNKTRGVFGGGNTTSGNSKVNSVEYVTIQTPGNATDLADLSTAVQALTAFAGNPS